MAEIEELSCFEIKKLLDNKSISSLELVKNSISVIDRLDQYNLVSEKLYDDAISSAKISDNKKGEDRLPLEGIPIAVKDIFCTKGHKTSAGSKMLEKFIAPYESTVTKNLISAGAIIICKTNMDEFAMGSASDTCYYGNVINPWTVDGKKPLTPGGSSGGSAAIVSALGTYFSLGTDTGGSIRQPAAFCGIVGLKPSYGRCSRYGIISFASSLDQAGPMTRNVEDAGLALGHMASYDTKDTTSAPEKLPDLLKDIKNGVKGLKIGIPKEYNIEGIPNEISKLWQKGAEWLKQEGAEIIDISLPHTKFSLPAYYIIAPAEASANLARYDGVKYGFRAEGKFEDLNQMYCETRSQGFGSEVKRRLLIGTYVLSSGYYDAYYLHAQKVRRRIMNDFKEAFEKVDIILTPTAPSEAFVLGEKKDDPISMYINDIFTVPSSLAGLPAISVPSGLSKNNFPLGLQLIADSFKEDTLLKAAKTLEEAASFNHKPELGYT